MHPVVRESCSHDILLPDCMELGAECLVCSLLREVQALETTDAVD